MFQEVNKIKETKGRINFNNYFSKLNVISETHSQTKNMSLRIKFFFFFSKTSSEQKRKKNKSRSRLLSNKHTKTKNINIFIFFSVFLPKCIKHSTNILIIFFLSKMFQVGASHKNVLYK